MIRKINVTRLCETILGDSWGLRTTKRKQSVSNRVQHAIFRFSADKGRASLCCFITIDAIGKGGFIGEMNR